MGDSSGTVGPRPKECSDKQSCKRQAGREIENLSDSVRCTQPEHQGPINVLDGNDDPQVLCGEGFTLANFNILIAVSMTSSNP